MNSKIGPSPDAIFRTDSTVRSQMASPVSPVISIISAGILFTSTSSAQSNPPQLFPDKEISFDLFSQAAFNGEGSSQRRERLEYTDIETEWILAEKMESMESMESMENYGNFDSSAFGGGIGINWFDGPIGVGLDYSLLSGYELIHSTNVNLIARKPFVLRDGESPIEIAPYVFVGGGVQAGRENLATGHAGMGLDLRFSQGPAIFLDAKYTVHDSDQDWPSVRLGIRIPLGPKSSSPPPSNFTFTPTPLPIHTPLPEHRPLPQREARPATTEAAPVAQPKTFDLWPVIDPTKKFPDNRNR